MPATRTGWPLASRICRPLVCQGPPPAARACGARETPPVTAASSARRKTTTNKDLVLGRVPGTSMTPPHVALCGSGLQRGAAPSRRRRGPATDRGGPPQGPVVAPGVRDTARGGDAVDVPAAARAVRTPADRRSAATGGTGRRTSARTVVRPAARR